LYNFFKFLASGVEEGPSLVSKLGSDGETCDLLGKKCMCTNFPINNLRDGEIFGLGVGYDGNKVDQKDWSEEYDEYVKLRGQH